MENIDSISALRTATLTAPASVAPAKLRKRHLHEAMLAIARIIRDLVTVVPIAFAKGALLAPVWIVTTFAFGTALMTIGGSVASTMGTIALIGGSVSAMLTVMPDVTTHTKQAWQHMKWVKDPEKMADKEAAVEMVTRKQTRVNRTAMVATTCLALVCWVLSSTDVISSENKVSLLEL